MSQVCEDYFLEDVERSHPFLDDPGISELGRVVKDAECFTSVAASMLWMMMMFNQ